MSDIRIVQNGLEDSFKIIYALPNYILLEEKDRKPTISKANLRKKLDSLLDYAMDCQVKRIGALINRESGHYIYFSKLLLSLGFERYAAKIEVYHDLKNLKNNIEGYELHSIEGISALTEEEFKRLWNRCMSGSENTPSTRSMDDHMESLKGELGENWGHSCKVFYNQGEPIGVTIPYLEPNTLGEGRLFYFGLLPEARGKELGAILHHQSLHVLKQLGANYYIGTTHETNKKMQHVFLKNGCSLTRQTESYYKSV